MTTMTEDPYVHHVPILAGGVGNNGVYNFYKKTFCRKNAKRLEDHECFTYGLKRSGCG
jgi:carboxymethylenebutenolidase